MRRIPDAVLAILAKDSVAYDALLKGILNYSAYAKTIRTQVEEWCKKPVQVPTLVTTLTRLRPSLMKQPELTPSFSLKTITLQSDLVELAFDFQKDIPSLLDWFHREHENHAKELFMSIRGQHEIAIICSLATATRLKKQFPKLVSKGEVPALVAVTASYDSELTFVPNVGYSLMRALALERINVVEILSTYSEVTFLVAAADASRTLEALRSFAKL